MNHPALVVVDVQVGFDDPRWGPRNNPSCERNVAALIRRWRQLRWPVVFVRHDSSDPSSPLAPGSPGHQFKPEVEGEPDLLIKKSLHSAFHGDPDLNAWLCTSGIDEVAVCGITTDHCVETTARFAAESGYRVLFPLDATHTFDRVAPDGSVVTADEIAQRTAASLNGEFAQVLTTDGLLQSLDNRAPVPEPTSGEAYFNQVAGNWDQLRAGFFSEAVRDQAIATADVQKGKLAADIGAGSGFVTEGLVRLGVRVIAVDQSQAMLEEMRKKFAGLEEVYIRSGSGDGIPILDSSVDYVFANMYLHHVEKPSQAISEMVRILKPGGRLVVTDLDEHEVEFLRAEHHDRWLGFRRSDVEAWLANAGLQQAAVVSTDESCRSTSTSGSESAAVGIFIASGQKP